MRVQLSKLTLDGTLGSCKCLVVLHAWGVDDGMEVAWVGWWRVGVRVGGKCRVGVERGGKGIDR